METGPVVEPCPGPHLLALPPSLEDSGQLAGEAGLEAVSPVTAENVPAVLENYLVLQGQLQLPSSGHHSPPPPLLLRHHLPLLQGEEGGHNRHQR